MERRSVQQPRIKHLAIKVGAILTLIPVIGMGLLLYALHARGVFDRTQPLTLIATDAEGVIVGMPIMFSGFPVGHVAGMTLDDNGHVRIEARIKQNATRWLRASSVFSLEKPLVGGARIRALSTSLTDPPLVAGAERPMVSKDAAQEIPQVIAHANVVLRNIDELIRPDSSLHQSLDNLKTVTERMAGDYGLLGSVTGGPEQARKLMNTVESVNALLSSLKEVTARADRVLAKADERMFVGGGMMDEAQKSLAQLTAMLGEARESLKQANAVLANAQAGTEDLKTAARSLKDGTADLGSLRAEVDESIRKMSGLIDEINRKWPLARKSVPILP